MENFNKIKKTKLFKSLTQKNIEYVNFLSARISPHISKVIANEMLNFALSKNASLNVYDLIEKDLFNNKVSVEKPVIHIVIAQTGGGKSSVSKKILNDFSNIVFIDGDIFKKYNPLSKLIIKHYPTYFGFLTGLDSYLHQDLIYKKSIEQKFNILIEVSPSTTRGLFNIDFKFLKNNGYKIITHILAVSKINALISVHERYEKQLINKNEISKLTDFDRALDSYYAMNSVIKNLLKETKIKINLYKRENMNTVFVKSNKKNCLSVFNILQKKDLMLTLINADLRIKNIIENMHLRNAPQKQYEQLEKVIDIIKNEKRNLKNG